VTNLAPHFSKVTPQSLAAFVEWRILDDACSTEMEKMPKKGTLKDARSNALCLKTGKLVLIKCGTESSTNQLYNIDSYHPAYIGRSESVVT
jgi:hypothetical protein